MTSEKRTARCTVHLTPELMAGLDRERLAVVTDGPGEPPSRSHYMAWLLDRHLAEQARKAALQAPCGAKGKSGAVCTTAAGHDGRHEGPRPGGGSVSWT